MRKLFRFLKPYAKYAILAPILMLIEVLMELLQPTLMARIVDDGIGMQNMSVIIRTGIFMVLASLVGVLGGLGCTYFSSRAGMSFGTDLRAAAFRKVQSFSFEEIDLFSTGSLITRLTNDVTHMQNVIQMGLRMMIRMPMSFVGGIIMAVSINPRLALLLLVSMPFIAALCVFVVKRSFPMFSQAQKRMDKVNNVTQENLNGVRVIRAFRREDFERSRFSDANDELMNTMVKAQRLMAVQMPVMSIIMNATIIAILWFGAYQVQEGTMLVGEIMAFISYMTQILMSMMMVGFMFSFLSRAKASADRINEVMDTEPKIANHDGAKELPVTKGEVEFKNITFRYPGTGGDPVLKDINMKIESGQTVALLGSTGSGKSTLVSLISRMYDPTEGEVIIDGTNAKDYDIEALRSNIGFILQQSMLFSGTIRDNILWGKDDATDEEVIAAAKAAQAHEFIMSFPNGYDTIVGERGANLSGGQKQRISIARALIKQPAIIIMDDSTSAVDMGTEARLREAIKDMIHCTCIIIAQRISSVKNCDKIFVIDDGRISAAGTHEELMQTSDIYKEIYDSQAGTGVLSDEQ